MKSCKISLVVAVLLLCSIFSTSAFASVSNDEVTSQKLKEADGTSGQNTNSGSGVKTGHIQNGAVTDAKITGPISASKIQDGVFQKKYANVIVVAKSGGDFTNPVDAMNFITDASESNPYLVKIMPGVYDIGINYVQMKPYVDIEGSGENVTTITGHIDGTPGVVLGANSAEIRFLKIQNIGTGYTYGMINSSASPKITNVTIGVSSNGIGYGIENLDASPTLTNVNISVTGGHTSYGVLNGYISKPKMSNTTIATSGTLNDYGVTYGDNSSPEMTNITVTSKYGIYSYCQDCSAKINHSVITGSANSIYSSGGVTTYISNTKLDGPVFNSVSTLKCVNVYSGSYDPISCQ